MKPKNFPARKLARKMKADGLPFDAKALEATRTIRTKKDRSSQARKGI